MIRNPIDHTKSLMDQHERFISMQTEEPFVLKYMNWLGHHEFGLGYKSFNLSEQANKYDKFSANFWLASWVSYYSYVKQFLMDENLYLIDYNDLLNHPKELLSSLNNKVDTSLQTEHLKPFHNPSKSVEGLDENLKSKALELYSELLSYKLKI